MSPALQPARAARHVAYNPAAGACAAQPFVHTRLLAADDAAWFMGRLTRPAAEAAEAAAAAVAAAEAAGDAAAVHVARHVAAQAVLSPLYHPWRARRGAWPEGAAAGVAVECTHFDVPIHLDGVDYVVRGSYVDAVPVGWRDGWVWSARRDTGGRLPGAKVEIIGGGVVPARLRVEDVAGAGNEQQAAEEVCCELVRALVSVFGPHDMPRMPAVVELGWMDAARGCVCRLPFPTPHRLLAARSP